MKPNPISFKKVPSLQELKSGYPNVKGFFFDMDGTLFNTEAFHAGALQMIGKTYHIRPPHSPDVVHGMMMGKADHFIFEIVKSWEGFPEHWTVQDFVNEKNKNLIDILSKEDPARYISPLVKKLLEDAQADGLFIALVTSSEKIITNELLKLSGLSHFFKIVLTRDDCPHHKPHPWPYLRAMELANMDKVESLIFEDSTVGLEAATNSGAHVIKAEWY